MARSRGRRTSASSGCERRGHAGAGREPGRDRPTGVRHLPSAGPGHGRGLHRSGRGRAARRRGRRQGAAAGDERLPQRRGDHRRRPCGRRRRDPPGLRIPLRKRRFRRGRRCCRPGLGGAAGGRSAGHGIQDRIQEVDGRRRGTGPRGTRPRRGHRSAAAGAGQGVRGRRRSRDAGGSRIIIPRRRSRCGPARGAVGLRRSDGVLRTLPAHRAPRGGADPGRHPRRGVGRRGTGMLDSAPPPEDHRGGALPVGGAHPRHADQALRRGAGGGLRHRVRGRRDGGVPRR